MNSILTVSGLHKSYGAFQLKDINFTLPENCITGFIGINGAGKTTTIRSILGLVPKDSGIIKLFGKDFAKHEKEIKNRIGIVLDEGAFYEELTMEDMKAIIAPAYTRWNKTEFKAFMDRFDLNPRQRISTLSKGMRMKFSLALALSHEADLLIMDEPTSGLDPLIRSQLMDILLEFMKKDGNSVFFSTHITSDLDKVADMIILINNGRIVFQEEKDILLDTHRIVKGNPAELSDDTRKQFLSIQETSYGFTGLTRNAEQIKSFCRKVLIEKPTIEDIMLGYIGGES